MRFCLVLFFIISINCSNFSIYNSSRGIPQLYDFSKGQSTLENFTNDFGCWGYPDPTHSHADYESGCFYSSELVTVQNGQLRIAIKNQFENSCSTGMNPTYTIDNCYPAIRLQSLDNYNTNPSNPTENANTYRYLFVIKTQQIPDFCSLWPAWWLCGDVSWPTSGEFDIIETVNGMKYNGVTGHTTNGCSFQDVFQNVVIKGKSAWKLGTQNNPSDNCYVNAYEQYANAGCGTAYEGTNYQGTFATLWSEQGFKVFYWAYEDESVSSKGGPLSTSPQPEQWQANLHMNFTYGKECNHTHFYDMSIIINTAICGDWCGAVFGSDCQGKGSCQDFIASNEFKEELEKNNTQWIIDQIRVYRETQAAGTEQLIDFSKVIKINFYCLIFFFFFLQ